MNDANSRRAAGKVKEIAGLVKKGLGTAIGSEPMARRGEAQQLAGQVEQDEAKAEERLRGTVDETIGKVKHVVGAVVGDGALEREGKVEELGGKARRALPRSMLGGNRSASGASATRFATARVTPGSATSTCAMS